MQLLLPIPIPLQALFDSIGLTAGLLLPLGIAILLSILLLPQGLRTASRSEDVCHALYCVLFESLGVILMTVAGLPALYAVFAKQPLTELSYLSLLLVFGIGGALYLWQDAALQRIDPGARTVPVSIFFYTWKATGMLVVLFAALSLLLEWIDLPEGRNGWWIPHLIMLLYGFLLSWFTLYRQSNPGTGFASVAKNPAPHPLAVAPQKTVRAKPNSAKSLPKAKRKPTVTRAKKPVSRSSTTRKKAVSKRRG